MVVVVEVVEVDVEVWRRVKHRETALPIPLLLNNQSKQQSKQMETMV